MCMKLEKRIIVYDDYNSKIYGGGLIGTITTNIGNPSPRNGFKLIEIYYEVHDCSQQGQKSRQSLGKR